MGYLEVLKSHSIPLPTPIKISYDGLIPKNSSKNPSLSDANEVKNVLQQYLEDLVENKETLAELARNGYLSWVGAYAVHSSETKHIFVPRELHFGHVAKSFALKEAPTKIKQQQQKKQETKNKKRSERGESSSEKNASLPIKNKITLYH